MDPVSGNGPNLGCAKTLNLGFQGILYLDQFQKPDPYIRNVIFQLQGLAKCLPKNKIKKLKTHRGILAGKWPPI
jgi:hypothetical protein